MFETLLIANRGEIAVRVARTARRMGLRTVAVHSDADARARHVAACDVAVRIGPAPARESYLSIDALLDAARRTGADALHPGYGFLSERPELARACEAAGVTFVGPGADAIALLGDKAAAKRVARAAGVPVVPGLDGSADDPQGDGPPDGRAPASPTDEEILAWAERAELPLLVKATAGGGGRGMRVVRELAGLPEALASARREAAAAFGDERLLVERYVERPRHIEVQVIADAHGAAIHLGERECSLQRRHQKVVEEAPSPVVGPELRARMGATAVDLARASGYVGAGTVELIADRDDPERFHFLELNARLQVEHPVTELVTGLDLVELQLRVAAGERLPLAQDDVVLDGHAVEARIYAEDPANGFLPSTGRIVAYREPAGVRTDSGVGEGDVVGSHYDPLLAKVIARGDDRGAALDRLGRALDELRVVGPVTNAAYLRALLERDEVRAGAMDTGLLERLGELASEDGGPALAADGAAPGGDGSPLAAVALVALLGDGRGDRGGDGDGRGASGIDDPWAALDGWRLHGRGRSAVALVGPGGEATATIEPDGRGGYRAGDVALSRADGAVLMTAADGVTRRIDAYRDGADVWLVDGAAVSRWRLATDDAGGAVAAGSLEAPMPGVVLDVRAAAGDAVAGGDVLVVLESMKMELAITSPADGVVGDVLVGVGDRVAQGQPLVAVEQP